MVSAIGISNISDMYSINLNIMDRDSNFGDKLQITTALSINDCEQCNSQIEKENISDAIKKAYEIELSETKDLESFTKIKTLLIKTDLGIIKAGYKLPAPTEDQLKTLDEAIANTDYQQEFVDNLKSRLNGQKRFVIDGGKSFVNLVNNINYSGLSDKNIDEIQDCINQCISDRGCSSLDETAKLG